ncbi:hypothetical protein HQQ94_19235 [Shewanella sp. VB17]|uniref:hypothetical protein n=1 Tax=Shewanella sp. VB17 TaxID=2739432 RepID=UPI0015679CC4|nr:hypothetical protein [Shewanella sp. VB17]NRD75318.1 hypothetical protein [Shewanella sp. VB17]
MSVYFESAGSFSFNSISIYVINLLLVIMYYKKIKFLYEKHAKSLFKFSFNIVVFFFVMFNVGRLIAGYESYVYYGYLNGKHENVEGTIEQYEVYESASRVESFEVKGIPFTSNNYGTSPLFFANRNYKDKVVTDGTYVRLSYVHIDGENYIVKVETAAVDLLQ